MLRLCRWAPPKEVAQPRDLPTELVVQLARQPIAFAFGGLFEVRGETDSARSTDPARTAERVTLATMRPRVLWLPASFVALAVVPSACTAADDDGGAPTIVRAGAGGAAQGGSGAGAGRGGGAGGPAAGAAGAAGKAGMSGSGTSAGQGGTTTSGGGTGGVSGVGGVGGSLAGAGGAGNTAAGSGGAAGTVAAGGNAAGVGGSSAGTGGSTAGAAGSSAGAGGDPGTSGSAGSGTVLVDAICQPWTAPADAFDQSVVPLEVGPVSASSKKIVLVAGASSASHPGGQHEFFAITALLAKMLCQTPGVVPVVVKNGWPSNESVFDGAATIVFYADGGAEHPLADGAHRAALQARIDAGVGFANLHYAVEYPVDVQAQVLPWLGGLYETGYSVNPLWRAFYAGLPAHPVLQGVGDFDIDDEWYYGLRFVDPPSGLTPLLSAVPPDGTRTTAETMAHPGRSETTAWAFERPSGGRSFGFTGGHWYGNWTDSAETPHAPKQRRVVVNGILWTAGVAIPEGGAPVAVDAADAGHYLDKRP